LFISMTSSSSAPPNFFAMGNHAKLWRGNGNAPTPRVFNPAGLGIGLAQPESGERDQVCDKLPGADRFGREQENCMNRFTRLLTLGLFSVVLAAAPAVVYAAPDSDPPPADSKKKKKSSEVRPGSEHTAFAAGYRAAYSTIFERGEYASAIEQLKALQRDDSAAVANLIGYSYRKLGDYKVSQVWYERALKTDPGHVKTWQYYGLWQVEQGNRDQAQYHLNRIAALAGTSSEEYRSLAAALEKPPGTGLVY
jgi:tetratricopeptide (TPR) repeat protein